jgi:hypothetical protein
VTSLYMSLNHAFADIDLNIIKQHFPFLVTLRRETRALAIIFSASFLDLF